MVESDDVDVADPPCWHARLLHTGVALMMISLAMSSLSLTQGNADEIVSVLGVAAFLGGLAMMGNASLARRIQHTRQTSASIEEKN